MVEWIKNKRDQLNKMGQAQGKLGMGSSVGGASQVEVVATQFSSDGEPTEIIADGESVGQLDAYRKLWMLLSGVTRLSKRVWKRIYIKWTKPKIIGN